MSCSLLAVEIPRLVFTLSPPGRQSVRGMAVARMVAERLSPWAQLTSPARSSEAHRPDRRKQREIRSCPAQKAVDVAIEALLAAHLEMPAGRLRIDLPLAFGRRCVVPILFDIAERFPHLTLDVSFTDRRVDLVPEGIDLTIGMGELDDRVGLVARQFYIQRCAVCAAPAYLDRHGRPQTIDDLKRQALIVYGRDCFVSPWFIPDAAGRPESTRHEDGSFLATASRCSTLHSQAAASPISRRGS
jgi:hypothetical protein